MSLDADTHGLNARLLKYRSHPEQEDAHSLAEDLIAARRYGDARGVAVSAQTDDAASDARLLVLEGRAWYLDRDLARAQAALVRAAKLDPYCGEAFRWLGEVLLKRGDPMRAERALERSLELLPGNADAERLLTRARQLSRHTPAEVAAPPKLTPAPAPAAPVARRGSTAAGTPAPRSDARVTAERPRAVRSSAGGILSPALKRAASASSAGMTDAALFEPEPEAPTAHFRKPTPSDVVAVPDSEFDDFAQSVRDEHTLPTRPGDVPAASRSSAAGIAAPRLQPTPAQLRSPSSSGAVRAASSNGSHSAPPSTSSPGMQRAAARLASSAGSQPAPERVPSSAGAQRAAARIASSPGSQPAPERVPSSPGLQSTPARSVSSPGLQPAPARSVSSPGLQPTPARSVSSPGLQPAPARSASSPGTQPAHQSVSSSPPVPDEPLRSPLPALYAPQPGSSSGGEPAPQRRSAPGIATPTPISELLARGPTPAQRARPAQRTTPGVQPASPPPSPYARSSEGRADKELDRALPGLSRPSAPLPPASRGESVVAQTASWDAPSVIATWPSLEPMGDEGRASQPQVDPPVYADDAAQDDFIDRDEVPEPPNGTLESTPPDLAVGDAVGEPDDPRVLLRVLEAQGVFEPPETAPPAWTQIAEVPRTGTRLRGALLGVWLTSLALLASGYFGWRQWIAIRHERAAQLVTQARAAAFDGDFARLVDAERLLSEARDNHPRSMAVPSAELFVQAQRVLENGSRELSALSAALRRAEQVKDEGDQVLAEYFTATRAVLDVYSGAATGAGKGLDEAASAARGEPALLYLIGRLEQRLGRPTAGARLQAAAAAAPDLLAAEFALAELAYEQGDPAAARARIDGMLKRRADHLRARLFQLFLGADSEDPAASLRTLDALAKDTRTEGAPVDRMLWALSRARLLRRSGDSIKAGEALREALAAGTSEPRLLALLAAEAQRNQQLGVAQQAASQAVSAAPHAAAYRALLASILLERHEGDRAYQLLSDLPEGNPTLASMRARAALEMMEPTALRASLTALEAEAAKGATGTELSALLLRLRAALEPKSQMLSEAKALLRKVPGDPDVLQALAEVALALREPRDAVSALDQLVKVSPDAAEAHFLLGRARRMAADADGAEQALRRALELTPSHAGALSALGSLLLDSGKYQEADALFQQLATSSPLQSRLGRAEALIGLRKFEDARIQVAGLSEQQRDMGTARETAARLAIALGKPGEALALLRPLVEAETKKPGVLVLQGDALYAADDVNAAAAAYEAALELDVDLPEALIGRAQIHLRAERPGEALDLLDDADSALKSRLRAPELRARVLTLRGRAYVQRDKRDDAERGRDALREAVRLPNAPAEAHFWLGEVLGGRKTPEAANALKRYLELEPKGEYAGRARKALGPLL